MLAQRILQGSARRALLVHQEASIGRLLILQRQIASTASSASSAVAGEHSQILIKQRLNRPVAPHLSIYRPQITWYASGLNRLTGLLFAGGLYAYSIAYLVQPVFNWHLESAVMAASITGWGLAAKSLTKFVIAAPFSYHFWASVRNLSWTWGLGMAKATVIKSGWTMVAASALTTLYLTFIW